jgi:hypothetical protein
MKNSTRTIALAIICIFAISMIISVPIASAKKVAVQATTRDAPGGSGRPVLEFKLGQTVYISYSVTGPVTLYVRDEKDNSIDVSHDVTASGDGEFNFTPDHMGKYGIYSSVSTDKVGSFKVIKPADAQSGNYNFVTPPTGSTNVDHTSTTGVDVSLSGLDSGQQIVVSTLNFGTTVPSTGIAVSGGTVSYYDVQVIKPDGSAVNSGAIATISIQNTAFTSSDVMCYYDTSTSTWVQATNQHYNSATHTLTGDIPASALTGTEVAVGGSSLFITPEYALGALGALIACFAAVGCVAVVKKRKASK